MRARNKTTSRPSVVATAMLASASRSRWPGSRSARMAFEGVMSHDQHIHIRAKKAVERLARVQDDRLVLVERRVQEHRHAAQALERSDQSPVARIGSLAHRLQTSASVDVRDG